MKIEFLIRNGTVVDGTGAPAYRADVRIRDGRIAEIGQDLPQQKGERAFDAQGCYVTPGVIEGHNHWDGAMWWSPMMEPLASYGVTTSVNGNCGFSMAPLSADIDIRPEIIDIFNYFEDVPEAPMKSAVTWDWRTWSEYKASVQRNVRTQVNIASFCGHIPLRLAVMGLEAWDRAATADEVARMCELLEDALAAGALGMSSNLLDYDRNERPLPSYKADDDEWRALIRVIARH
ncbi:MAG: D-aminoacylase, partial [Sphingomonadales bacterium]